ncbi:MAG: hypothetical protein ACO4CU_14440, partial [Ilumatobacteraceae bacterium]
MTITSQTMTSQTMTSQTMTSQTAPGDGESPDRRLAAVHRLDPGTGGDGTCVDSVLDGLVCAAATMLDTPMAFVSILDDERQWLRARYGLDITATPRDIAICDLVVTSGA